MHNIVNSSSYVGKHEFACMCNQAGKGAARGWQKYLWDSPTEQTCDKGEAVSANKRSTAHCAR